MHPTSMQLERFVVVLAPLTKTLQNKNPGCLENSTEKYYDIYLVLLVDHFEQLCKNYDC